MRGSLRERRPGVWELIVQLPRDPSTGVARQLSRTFRGNKREAQRALAALVTEVSAGKVASTSETLGELLDKWLDHVEDQLSPTTAREYRRVATTLIVPKIGQLTLRRVTTQRLDALYNGLVRERGLSPASVRQVHAVLRGALGQAVRWGWLPTNPAAAASPPKIRRHEIIPPTLTDTRALLHRAEAHDPELGAVLRVIAATGARRGEVCALRWADIDPSAGTVVISRSIAVVGGAVVEKGTKTHASRRIALDPETLTALDAQLQRMRSRAEACQVKWDPKSFVFSRSAEGSEPLHPDLVTGAFRRLCSRLGIEGVRLHDLRHLHATQLLAAGVPVRTISGRLGHANAATTLNVYAHFLAVSDREAADVIGGLLSNHKT